MGHDHRELPEELVAADVVSVVVRVQQVLDRLVGRALDLLHDAGSQVLELRVDHHHRLGAHEEAHVAAAAVEGVDAARQRLQAEDLVGRAIVVALRALGAGGHEGED